MGSSENLLNQSYLRRKQSTKSYNQQQKILEFPYPVISGIYSRFLDQPEIPKNNTKYAVKSDEKVRLNRFFFTDNMHWSDLFIHDKIVYDVRKFWTNSGSVLGDRNLQVQEMIAQGPVKFVQSLNPYYEKKSLDDRTLIFESRFESGNLALVAQQSLNDYHIMINNDINTESKAQWFYFRVSNVYKDMTVRFNIVNFENTRALYKQGMKICVNSVRSENGWARGGKNIAFYANGKSNYNTLSFEYKFLHDGDVVYFAYWLPYTYTDLQNYVQNISSRGLPFVKFKNLWETVLGNRVPWLTITNPKGPKKFTSRRGIVLSGRVHPGETTSSFAMQGAIEFLLSSDEKANYLRDNYIFKIVPMLNPDGVINGNYRCNAVGVDLNRRWNNPLEFVHPTIFHLKHLIQQFNSVNPVAAIIDFHGHSKTFNTFMYGCSVPDSPQRTALIPHVLSKLNTVFNFSDWNFNLHRAKASTLRIALFRELNIDQWYTIETSLWGADFGEHKNVHFTQDMLEKIGRDTCISLGIWCGMPFPVRWNYKFINLSKVLGWCDAMSRGLLWIDGENEQETAGESGLQVKCRTPLTSRETWRLSYRIGNSSPTIPFRRVTTIQQMAQKEDSQVRKPLPNNAVRVQEFLSRLSQPRKEMSPLRKQRSPSMSGSTSQNQLPVLCIVPPRTKHSSPAPRRTPTLQKHLRQRPRQSMEPNTPCTKSLQQFIKIDTIRKQAQQLLAPHQPVVQSNLKHTLQPTLSPRYHRLYTSQSKKE